MRRIFSLTAFFLAMITAGRAQSKSDHTAGGKGKVSGNIKDGSQKSIQSATIILLRARDSVSVKFATADKDGNYEFINIPLGKYLVSVSSVVYNKAFSQVFEVSETNSEITVPAITLTEATKSLGEVTVTTRRPFIETKIDKTVVNVESSPTSAGSTAMEVLEKSPGITVDNDGNISLRGKAGVIIMMDGKPTYLSAADLANLLKNMPASALDQIEIMTNPSSKYDASGNSGVINIKTKKGQAGGFNGSVMVGVTTSFFTHNGTLYVIPKTQNSINFNWRKKKINFFGNYNPNSFKGMSRLQLSRRVFDNAGNYTGYNDVETRFKFGNNNHTLKLGMDVFADKKNTFGVVVSGFTFSGHPTPRTMTTLTDLSHQVTSVMISNTDNKIKFQNLTANFNYRHVFDSAGRELTADLDFVAYDNTSNMLLATDFYDATGQNEGNLLLRGHLPAQIHIYSVKSDYTHPFKKGGRIEAGFKSSLVKNDNLVEYTRWDGLKWVVDEDRANHFIYDENINAAYVNVNRQIGKWSFQAGLRVENTNAKGHQVANDSTFKRNFTNLFPSAFISYTANKSNTLTVSYSRRINRPNYQDMNPFTYFLDSLSYRQGNPFLLPQFSHNIELSHSFKGKLITTLSYNNTNDVIAQIIRPDLEKSKLIPENVAKFRNMAISVTAPVPVTKWWNMNLFTNVYNNRYKGEYNGKPLDISYTSFMVNMTQTFTVKQGFTLELTGFYRAKGVDQLTINEPMYMFGLGGQKTILKGKGTLRLNFRDPLWIQQYEGRTRYDKVDIWIRNRWDNRSVTATFTYRFGKNTPQNQQPRRRNSATQDEQSRVGQGGQ